MNKKTNTFQERMAAFRLRRAEREQASAKIGARKKSKSKAENRATRKGGAK